MSKKESRGKMFSCVECNTPFISYPPDDLHTTASLDSSQLDDPIEVKHECENCHNFIKLYWGSRKMTARRG